MFTTQAMILMGVLFVGVTALVGAAAVFLRDMRASKPEDRLAAFTGKRQSRDEVEQAQILRERAFESDKRTLLDQFTPNLPNVERIFEQADVNIKPSSLFGLSVLLAIIGGTISYAMTKWIFLAPVTGLIMFSIPWMWLLYMRKRRLGKFASQLPDAMELIARALRAGHSMAAGMHVVAEEMPPPIATEFGRVFEEQNLGIPLEESMRSMCERVPNIDLRFFVTSVAIQRQTGGDLAEILDKIGYIIRERFRILGQVKALTAEGRLSGVILLALPFVLFFMIMHINPEYIELLWTRELGIWMVCATLINMVIGAFVIRWIVNIKV